MRIALITIATVFFLTSPGIRAQALDPINISGTVTFENVSKSAHGNNFRICVSKYPFVSLDQEKADEIQYEVHLTRSDSFNITIPSPDNRLYVRFTGTGGIGWIDDIFIVQAGDDINVKINGKRKVFYGKGKDKMNCQAEILNEKHKASNHEAYLLNNEKYVEYVQLLKSRSDSALNRRLILLEKYKSIISDDFYQTMLATCYGLAYNEMRALYISSRVNQKFFQSLQDLGDHWFTKPTLRGISIKNQESSPTYANYLLESYILKSQLVKGEQPVVNANRPKYILNAIMSHNEGLLRDKLLSLFSIRYEAEHDASLSVDQAFENIKDPFYRDLIGDKYVKLAKNQPYFNFMLSDDQGKMVKLSDYKDKVVHIDFWFTGCRGCLVSAAAMPFVIEKFKEDDRVKFLTISIDKTRELWINGGLRSGKYTHEQQINLFTNGLGKTHPLIEYYKISAYPRAFLLKNGRIFSSSPPMPQNDANGIAGKGSHELIEMIESALKDK